LAGKLTRIAFALMQKQQTFIKQEKHMALFRRFSG
jgi:hypothetical protein